MIRFGRWLKSRGAQKVYYLIVPAEVNDVPVKGVDDFFAAGGTAGATQGRSDHDRAQRWQHRRHLQRRSIGRDDRR
jgi:hypothetical protein